MKKSIICRLTIEIEIESDAAQVVYSNNDANKVKPIVEIVQGLNAEITKQTTELGFQSVSSVPRYVSQMNGGYAMYSTFKLESPFINLKILVDVRAADHSSKPNLKIKNDVRKSQFFNIFPQYDGQSTYLHVVDTYCTNNDWGMNIYVGKGDTYSKPVSSLEDAANIVRNQLRKVVSDKFVSALTDMLSNYPDNLIKYAEDYLNDISDVSILDLSDNEWKYADDVSDVIAAIRVEYLQLGLENDLFVDVADFDRVCRILQLIDKYQNI